MSSRSTTWSLLAGVYVYLWGTVTLSLLSPLPRTIGPLAGLPEAYASYLMAAPAVVIGAALWWALVERPAAYGYAFGAAFGLLTAALTVLAWVLRYVDVWGLELVRTGWLLIAAVLVVTGVAGLVGGLPFMYARRRLAERRDAPRPV